MTLFEGSRADGAAVLDYEQTLEALLGLVGRPVLVLFSGVDGSPFIVRPDEFERAFWRGDEQLVMHLGRCAISILAGGKLGAALER